MAPRAFVHDCFGFADPGRPGPRGILPLVGHQPYRGDGGSCRHGCCANSSSRRLCRKLLTSATPRFILLS
jgi:hypothetical protein